SSGVAQVNTAMGRVDQVTQRNASAAEELASTAEEMSAQAEGLEQLVAFFRVAGDAAAVGAMGRADASARPALSGWGPPAAIASGPRAPRRTNAHAARPAEADFRPF